MTTRATKYFPMQPAAVVFAMLQSCVSTGNISTQKSMFYSQALTMTAPEQPRQVMLLALGSGTPANELVPYVALSCLSTKSESGAAQRLWAECIEHRPDVVSYASGEDVQTGAVGQYWGWGISTATPTYARSYRAWCLRAPDAILPFRSDGNGMVLQIDADEAQSGLIEGDTVLSANGATYDKDQGFNSSWFGMRLALKPGEEVSVVAIRPGTGRVTAKVRAKPNPRTFANLEDLRPAEAEVKGSPKGWRLTWKARDDSY